jgi:hypothetical protein
MARHFGEIAKNLASKMNIRSINSNVDVGKTSCNEIWSLAMWGDLEIEIADLFPRGEEVSRG